MPQKHQNTHSYKGAKETELLSINFIQLIFSVRLLEGREVLKQKKSEGKPTNKHNYTPFGASVLSVIRPIADLYLQ